MTDALATQGFVLGVGEATPETRAFTTYVLSLAQYPSEDFRTQEAFVNAVTSSSNTVNTYTSFVFAVVRGRDTSPRIRVWTYTLDGHDYYVLRLGATTTLMYDTLTDEWSELSSGSSGPLRVNDGSNWNGAVSQAAVYGSNVITGDDGNGALYFLDPDADQDEDPLVGGETLWPFTREIQTQIPLSSYDRVPCYGLQVRGSIGSYAFADGVTLTFSDDRGATYTSAGEISIDVNDTDQRLFWRSLGSMKAPGRLFKITDDGALKRIDSIDLDGVE